MARIWMGLAVVLWLACVQARAVTLFYNGVKTNTVFWREVRVGESIDPALFAPDSATSAELAARR